MLINIRESKISKVFAVFLALNLLINFFSPTTAFALTGGPSQPEVQSFEPIGTTEMVDLFTGDFTYNIPLMDVGGYPVNISYHSGVTTDQEASWVGLGWNINPGVINRGMRGLPDDFNGDEIVNELNIKENKTYGIDLGFGAEFFGLPSSSLFSTSFGINYNNYVGVGMEFGANFSFSQGAKDDKNADLGLTGALSLSAGTNGVGISPSLNYEKTIDRDKKPDITTKSKLGLGYNSRMGLSSINLSSSASVASGKEITKWQRAKGKSNKSRNIYTKKYKSDKWSSTTTKRTKGINGGASISFATPAYTPQISMAKYNSSFSFRMTLGLSFFGAHPEVDVSGYYSTQYLSTNSLSEKSYGYLYLQDAYSNSSELYSGTPVLDINRENDGAFSKHTPALPVSNISYDVYSVSGQGIGGTYRPTRGSIGIISDRTVWNRSDNITAPTIEIGGGNAFHVGTNYRMNSVNTRTGMWTSGNSLANNFSFYKNENGDLYETVYFKQVGEKTYDPEVNINSGLFGKTGAFDVVRVGVNKNGFTQDKLFNKFNTVEENISGDYKRGSREKRNEVISYLTAEEASEFGEETVLNFFNTNYNIQSTGFVSRVDNNRLGHHISQVNVTRADGARYIYGIPAYNFSQTESSFAIPGKTIPIVSEEIIETESGVTDFPSDADGILNHYGRDNFYSKKIIPAYAHSYLLTHVYSSDYVDSDNIPGPSNNDLGSYTKFNYSRIGNYDWRVPYESGTANYSEGLRSQDLDDKASYISGNKELWYLHSIESKTHIAFFETEFRDDDGLGVSGNGKMKKLKAIKLYIKKDGISDYSLETPIKTVHFVYSDATSSICTGIANGTGKLTLKEIYFTYGISKKGELNRYKFDYGKFYSEDGSVFSVYNPQYNIKANDRWGTYKPNSTTQPNAIYPYTSQEKAFINSEDRYLADMYATAWNLSNITLPSGGKIEVNYEADDYAFVQNKKAMQMFNVHGVENSSSPSTDELYENDGAQSTEHRNKIIIDLPDYYFTSGNNITIQDLLNDENGNLIKNMYFKFLINLGKPSDPAYEYVSGWAKVVPGLSSIDVNNQQAIIELENVPIHDPIGLNTNISPIVQTALNFTQQYLPSVAYNQPVITSSVLTQVIDALASTATGIMQFVGGTNRIMMVEGKCSHFKADKSFIRLYNPIGQKKGGGVRVKRIKMIDSWTDMTGNESSSVYGQEYNYTTNIGGKIISSGVAAYEPAVGGDENPFRQPLFYSNEKLLVPDDEYVVDLPLGESYFPSANVGYSKVTVSNYTEVSNAIGTTGRVEYEFYTAKDYPTKIDRTNLEPGQSLQRKKTNPILNIFKFYQHDKLTASQGFLVELNDMHGKQKSIKNYSETNTFINGTGYFYKKNGNKLDNNATIINPEGEVDNRLIGVDFDFIVDMRESKTETNSAGMGGNLDAFLAVFFPAAIPMVLPNYGYEQVRFRSVVTTKIINRYALLERTEAYQDGSIVSTENLAYDSETGEVLLTKTSNEFNDVYYSFNYPAHWEYDGMGQAYKNIGYEADVNIGIWNNVTTTNLQFTNGDELMVYDENGTIGKYWFKENSFSSFIINETGTALQTGDYTVKVLRSGRKNIQNISIGSIVSRNNPISNGTNVVFDTNSEIVSSNAVLLTDNTLLACNCQGAYPGINYNPFVQGTENNWRKDKEYVFLSQRTTNSDLRTTNYNTNIRDNGIYTEFTPFWYWNSSYFGPTQSSSQWTWTNEVTKYSPYGMELENMNPLNQYSSAIYGYGGNKVTTISNNAEYKEIGFDSFEDYGMDNCTEDHFSFEYPRTDANPPSPLPANWVEDYFGNYYIIEGKSHTGRKSIKLDANSSIRVVKQLNSCN